MRGKRRENSPLVAIIAISTYIPPMHYLTALLVSLGTLFAAFERMPSSPLQMGMGFSTLGSQNNPSAMVTHPASMSLLKTPSVQLFYSNSYHLSELDFSGAAVAVPLSFTVIGATSATFGSSLYRETSLSLAAAREIGNNLSVGMSVTSHELTIKNYGSTRTFALTVSADYEIAADLRWALQYRNVNSPRIGTSEELLPQVVTSGILFSPSEQLTASLEVEKDLLFTPRFKFGGGWSPIPGLRFAAGFATNPSQATAAIQITLKGQKISYAVATHPALPVSQMVALQFHLP